jgi:hypothetical protein
MNKGIWSLLPSTFLSAVTAVKTDAGTVRTALKTGALMLKSVRSKSNNVRRVPVKAYSDAIQEKY